MLFTLLAMMLDLDRVQLGYPAMIEIGTNLQLQFDIAIHGLVLAQQFQSTDILGNIQNGWNDFVQSGKAGTFAIGLVIGYVLRGVTR